MKTSHIFAVLSLFLVSLVNAECIRPKATSYTKTSCLQEGLSIVSKNNKYGVIDVNGKEIVPLQYDYIGGFSNSLSPARKGNKRGYINKQGKEVIPFEFDFVGNFEDGIAKVNKNGKWFYINRMGEFVKDAAE